MILTRKRKKHFGTWWPLAKTAALEHSSTSPSGKFPCLGQSTATPAGIVNDSVLRPLLNKSIPIKTLASVIEARGFRVTTDVIKKANSISIISGSDHAESFNKIEPYLFEIAKLNHGMHYRIDRNDDTSLFHRLIIIPHYTTSILQYMYPIVGLDSAHMKTIVVSNATKSSPRMLLEKLYIALLTTKLPGM